MRTVDRLSKLGDTSQRVQCKTLYDTTRRYLSCVAERGVGVGRGAA